MKDQASKLREMMLSSTEKKQQEPCIPVAVFSCGADDGLNWTRDIALRTSEKGKKKTLFVRPEETEFLIKEEMENKDVYGKGSSLLFSEVTLDFAEMHEAIKNREDPTKYSDIFRSLEADKEVLFYYCGKTINAKAMNLIALSSVVLLFVNRSVSSVEMALNMIRVQQKIQNHTHFLLAGIDMDETLLQDIVLYIKKESVSTLERSIKGVVTFSLKEGQLENEREADWKMIQIPMIGKSKTLSERLKAIE